MRVSPGRRIGAVGPSRHGQRLLQQQSSAEMLLPCIHPFLWLLLLLPGELPSTPPGGFGGPRLHGGAPKGVLWRVGAPLESSASIRVGLLGKMWLCRVYRVCFLVNGKSVSAEAFVKQELKVECFNAQGICFPQKKYIFLFALFALININTKPMCKARAGHTSSLLQ